MEDISDYFSDSSSDRGKLSPIQTGPIVRSNTRSGNTLLSLLKNTGAKLSPQIKRVEEASMDLTQGSPQRPMAAPSIFGRSPKITHIGSPAVRVVSLQQKVPQSTNNDKNGSDDEMGQLGYNPYNEFSELRQNQHDEDQANKHHEALQIEEDIAEEYESTQEQPESQYFSENEQIHSKNNEDIDVGRSNQNNNFDRAGLGQFDQDDESMFQEENHEVNMESDRPMEPIDNEYEFDQSEAETRNAHERLENENGDIDQIDVMTEDEQDYIEEVDIKRRESQELQEESDAVIDKVEQDIVQHGKEIFPSQISSRTQRNRDNFSRPQISGLVDRARASRFPSSERRQNTTQSLQDITDDDDDEDAVVESSIPQSRDIKERSPSYVTQDHESNEGRSAYANDEGSDADVSMRDPIEEPLEIEDDYGEDQSIVDQSLAEDPEVDASMLDQSMAEPSFGDHSVYEDLTEDQPSEDLPLSDQPMEDQSMNDHTQTEDPSDQYDEEDEPPTTDVAAPETSPRSPSFISSPIRRHREVSSPVVSPPSLRERKPSTISPPPIRNPKPSPVPLRKNTKVKAQSRHESREPTPEYASVVDIDDVMDSSFMPTPSTQSQSHNRKSALASKKYPSPVLTKTKTLPRPVTATKQSSFRKTPPKRKKASPELSDDSDGELSSAKKKPSGAVSDYSDSASDEEAPRGGGFRRRKPETVDIIPEKPELKVVIPEPVSSGGQGQGLRRSKRIRVPPLEHWRNERIIYALENGDIERPKIKAILRADRAQIYKEEQKRKQMMLKRGQAIQASRKRHQDNNSDAEDGDGKGGHNKDGKVDKESLEPFEGPLVDKEVFEGEAFTFPPDDNGEVEKEMMPLAWGQGFDLKTVMGGTHQVASLFSREAKFAAAGVLSLKPGMAKPTKPSKHNHYFFFVMTGAVQVSVNDVEFAVLKGGSFVVPRGNYYSLKNLKKDDDTLMYFVQCTDTLLNDEKGIGPRA